MNIMNKVTWKCMKQNKKRTIVTIIGVIICVAMITGVCTIAASFQDTMIKNAIYQNGTYEISANIDQENYKQLQNEDKLHEMMRMVKAGVAKNPIEESYRVGVDIYGVDVDYLELIGAKLIEGKLPSNTDEVMVITDLMEDKTFAHHIGDSITLPMGYYETYEGTHNFIKQGEKTYKITGIYSCRLLENTDAYTMLTVFDDTFVTKDNPMSVNFNLKTDKQFFDQVEELSQKYEFMDIHANNSVLLYKGISDKSVLANLMSVGAFLGLIILIGGFSLIYNAFSISLSERSRYLGMLSSIGATKKQKRASVFFEAFLIGIIAIPIGLLSGILGIKITFYFMSPYFANVFDIEGGLSFLVNKWCIIIPVVFSIFVLIISAWVPSRKASHINAISAIRQNGDFKIRKRDIKTSKLTRKLFGFEAELGLKNIKRYHARYLATLFSLIICIVLFMSASYFTSSMTKTAGMVNHASNYDLKVDFYFKDDQVNLQLPVIQQLEQARYAKNHTLFTESSFHLTNDIKLSKDAQAFVQSQIQRYDHLSDEDIKNMYYPRLYIQVLDDQSFAKYCDEVGVDVKDMQQKEPSFIFVNERNMYNDMDGSYREMKIVDNVSDKITIMVGDETNKTQNLHIVKQVDQVPDINPGYSSSLEVHAITNFANAKLLNKELEAKGCPQISTFYGIQYQSDDAEELGKEVKKIIDNSDEISASLDKIAEQRIREEQRTILISVFLYGFVVLILLICMTNIMNTISTSISLRKRELAMLKSIGITPSKFKKMMIYETMFYGIKAVAYGVPLGILCMFIMNLMFGQSFTFAFQVSWFHILCIIIGVFLMLMIAMWYAISKIRKDNIVETIRNESI